MNDQTHHADEATLTYIAALEAEVATLRGEHPEYLCEKCRVIHPLQRKGILQPCPDCNQAMHPTSRNFRRISELEAENEWLKSPLIQLQQAQPYVADNIQLKEQLAAAKEENERLKADVSCLEENKDYLVRSFAAAQLRAKELREIISEAANWYDGDRTYLNKGSVKMLEKMYQALSTTDNDEALRRYVAGEMVKVYYKWDSEEEPFANAVKRYEKGETK